MLQQISSMYRWEHLEGGQAVLFVFTLIPRRRAWPREASSPTVQWPRPSYRSTVTGMLWSSLLLYLVSVEWSVLPHLQCCVLLCCVLLCCDYRKSPKNSDTWKTCYNHPKIWTRWLYHWLMCPKDAEGIANSVEIANSVDPDQTAPPGPETAPPGTETAPQGPVWSGPALFAQTCPSENLGSLWHIVHGCEDKI